MKLNIELRELDLNEANVVLAALQALKTSTTISVAETPVENTPVVSISENTNLPDRDVDGLPWDERIHSSNHKLNADGRWQRRRNIDEQTYVTVRSQLLGESPEQAVVTSQKSPLNDIPTAVETPVAPVQPVTSTEFSSIPATPIPVVETPAPLSVPVAEPVNMPEPVQPVEPSANDLYTQMFAKLQVGFREKKVDANYIANTVKTLNGLFGTNWTGLAEIKDNPSALKVVIDQLTKAGL